MTKNPKNSNVEGLCRICSNRASYDLFQIIPAYLHETEDEYKKWKCPISYYVEVVLEKPVKRNDGLPQRMCVLCISYMKHAFNFKMQALRNAKLYKQEIRIPDEREALAVVGGGGDKETEHKDLSLSIEQLIKDNNLEDMSDDNLEVEEGLSKSMFTYRHTSFEEDDITDMAVFQSNQIGFYLPETFKERKVSRTTSRILGTEV